MNPRHLIRALISRGASGFTRRLGQRQVPLVSRPTTAILKSQSPQKLLLTDRKKPTLFLPLTPKRLLLTAPHEPEDEVKELKNDFDLALILGEIREKLWIEECNRKNVERIKKIIEEAERQEIKQDSVEETLKKENKNETPKSSTRARAATIDLYQLGGSLEIKEQLGDVVRYLQDPFEFAKSGATPPKGIILSGPPGVGKTMLAEAVAGHAEVPIIVVSGSEMIGQYVGEGEKLLRTLFTEAEESGPCVLLIDEIDSLGAIRFSPPRQSAELHANTIVNQLLTLLSKLKNVVVFATTNHYEALDTALVRPGRFDKHIIVSLPTKEEREDILKILTKNKTLAPDVSLSVLADLSPSFSGARLTAWINEAALIARRDRDSSVIEIEDLNEARAVSLFGPAVKNTLTPEHEKYVAVHEAGHAVVAYLMRRKIHHVSIIKRGKSYGHTEYLPLDQDQLKSTQYLLDEICIGLAGRAAEIIFGLTWKGSKNDLEKAKSIAESIIEEGMGATLSGLNMTAEVEIMMQEQMARAIRLLKEHEYEWKNIINGLVKNKELSHSEFDLLMEAPWLVTSYLKKSSSRDNRKINIPKKKSERNVVEAPHDLIKRLCRERYSVLNTVEILEPSVSRKGPKV